MNEEKNNTTAEVKNNNNVLETAKNYGQVAVTKAAEFSKKGFGKVKGMHIIIGGIVVIILLLLILFNSKGKGVLYPIVYNNDEGELYLMTSKAKDEEDAVKLSGDDTTTSVIYANTTDRYLLFLKGSDLYLYDAKSKDATTKIVADADDYFFTDDDKYIVALDEDSNLYSYDYGKEKERLDTDVSTIYDYTDRQIVYKKDDTIYVRSLNAKKDDRAKISDDYKKGLAFSEDGKKILYINGNSELISYNVSKKENSKIAGDVSNYYCDLKSCDKLYYVVADGENTLYYYDGKDSSKIVSDIYTVYDIDVEEQKVIYGKLDDGEYTLFYQNGTKDAAIIEDGLDGVSSVRIYNGKDIYYINGDDELRYAKASGAKVSETKTIAEDVTSSLSSKLNGYAFVADVDSNNNGTLYFASNGKAKEIDKDVYYMSLVVSKDGKKVYYLKDYKTTGDLYVTSGGKGKKLETEIRTFSVVNDKLIYMLKDYSSSKERGDLFKLSGSKSVKLAENVTRLAHIPVSYQSEK